ncbi:MAG: heme-binding protein [Rhodospirillales bacterium]|nr:heme-binding protein [Rhodospirillales bacterium]
MEKLTLAQADTIIDQTFAKGAELGFKPLTVAVLDDGGNLVAFKKQDNSSVLRFEIARGKAFGAIGMGTSSRNLAKVAEERPSFMAALVGASGGKVVPVPGGLLVKTSGGDIIGSIGISGDNSDNDETAGKAGIEAAGLTTD